MSEENNDELNDEKELTDNVEENNDELIDEKELTDNVEENNNEMIDEKERTDNVEENNNELNDKKERTDNVDEYYKNKYPKAYYKDIPVSEGDIVPLYSELITDFTGDCVRYVAVKFSDDINSQVVRIPQTDIQSMHIKKYIPKWFRLNMVMIPAVEKVICNHIIRRSRELKPKQYRMVHQGYNFLEDKVIYVWGDKIINCPDQEKYNIADKYYSPKFKNHKIGESLDFILRFSNLGEHMDRKNDFCFPAVLIIAALVPFVLPLIDPAKREMYNFVTYIIGPSGTGKTSVAKLLTNFLYDDIKCENCINMIDLASDDKSIESFSRFKDCAVLLDGLKKNDDRSLVHTKETNASKVISSLRGTGNYDKKSTNVMINAHVFMTADYYIDKAMINRVLAVKMPDVFNRELLTWLQDNRDLWLNIVDAFISAICRFFDTISRRFNDALSEYEYKDKHAQNEIGWYGVKNFEALLMTTVDLYNTLIYGRGIITPPEISEFKRSIKESVEETLKLYAVDKEFIKEIEEVKKFISRIFNDKDIVITDIEEFIGDERLTIFQTYSEGHVDDKVFYDETKESYYVTTKAYNKIMDSKCSAKALSQLFSKFKIIKEKGGKRKFQPFRKYGCDKYFIVIYKAEAKSLLEEDMFDR